MDFELPLTEAAELLSSTPDELRRRVRGGEFDTIKRGNKTLIKVPSSALPFTIQPNEQMQAIEVHQGEIVEHSANDGRIALPREIEFMLMLVRAMKRPDVEIKDKLILSLDEARHISGLPHAQLRDAIKSGDLKALRRGNRYQIKRSDLEAFVKKL